MNLFQWLERLIFLGEVVKDYGCVSERVACGMRCQYVLLLCRRYGELRLVVKTIRRAFLQISVTYEYIPACIVPHFAKVAEDIEKERLGGRA